MGNVFTLGCTLLSHYTEQCARRQYSSLQGKLFKCKIVGQTCVQYGWQQNYFLRFENIDAKWTAIKETKWDQVKNR
jgi:hypothetical protein